MTSRKRRRKGAMNEEVNPLQEFIALGQIKGPPCDTPQKRVFNNMRYASAEDRDRVAQKHFDTTWDELVISLGTFPEEYIAHHEWFTAELDRICALMREHE